MGNTFLDEYITMNEIMIIISVAGAAGAWLAGRKTGYHRGLTDGFTRGYAAGIDAARRIMPEAKVKATPQPRKSPKKNLEEPAWLG